MTRSTILSLLIGLSVAAVLIGMNDPGHVVQLLLAAGWWMPLIVALYLMQVAASAFGWAPLIVDERRPSALRLISMRWIRNAVNTLLPVVQAAGELVRAQLLARQGVARRHVVASIAADLGSEMVSQILFSLLGLAVLLSIPHEQGDATVHWAMLGTALGAGVAALFVAAQYLGLFRLIERFLPKLARRLGWTSLADLSGLHEAVVSLYRQPSRLWRSGSWHFLSWLIGVLESWAALHALGIEASLAEALVIESLGQAIRSAGFFVPAALGIHEGGYVLICALFGIPPDQAIALALVRRLRDILAGLPGLFVWRWSVAAGQDKPAAEGLPRSR